MKKFEPLEPHIVSEFRNLLRRPEGAPLCYAPFNNMAFNSLGFAGACFQSYFHEEELRYPRATLKEIWFSKQFQRLRDHIHNKDLNYKCKKCKVFMEDRNFVSVPINGYGAYSDQLKEYPSSMELELSNKCNLECIMCIGELSSNVRKNRDNLPPILSPYDEKFVEQLKEFAPHLKEIKFLGGEPTLIQVYYLIWEMMIEVNPACMLFVTSNANALSMRFKRLLEMGNFHMNISIDSLRKDVYEGIRKNGNFDKLMEHIDWYINYKNRKKTTLQISFIPMTLNCIEVPGIISFGNKHGIKIWLHTLNTNPELHLKNLPLDELEGIAKRLDRIAKHFMELNGPDQNIIDHNMQVYSAFREKQFEGWMREAK